MMHRRYLNGRLLATALVGVCGRLPLPSALFDGNAFAFSPRRDPPSRTAGMTIAVTPDDDLSFVASRSYNVVIFEKGPAPNRLFVEALFSVFDVVYAASRPPVSISPQGPSGIAPAFQDIKWLDRRPLNSLRRFQQPGGTVGGDEADELYENISDRAAAFAGAFNRFGWAGPWILSVGETPKGAARAVLLDFTRYPEFDYIHSVIPREVYPRVVNNYRRAIIGWYNDIIKSDFWAIEPDELARIALFSNLQGDHVEVWMRNRVHP